MFKKPSPSEGANKEIVLQPHMKSIFADIDIAVCVFFWRHFFFLLLHVVHIVHGEVMFSGEKKCVDMADLFYSSFLFELSKSAFWNCLLLSLFFFCDTFSNTDLKCKEGYYMCESYFLSIYFATCVIIMF